MSYPFFTFRKNTLRNFCLVITLAILIAGLWPFNFCPQNKVQWEKERNGIHFYGQGIIFSDPSQESFSNNSPFTIEICLQPDSESIPFLPRILSLYDGKGSEDFFIGQWKSHLVLRTKVSTSTGGRTYREVGVKNALPKGKRRHIAIVAVEKGTYIYVDGRIEKAYPDFSLLPNFTASSYQIILGNSPTGKDYWTGYLYGLAIYKRSLDPGEIFQHYKTWIGGNTLFPLLRETHPFILSFHEPDEKRIHDPIRHYALLMPPRFTVPQKKFLVPPWKDSPTYYSSYFQDILLNTLGFIPFGFFISALIIKRIKSNHHCSIIVILLGFSLSFLIEIIQVYLPNRYSQLMDIFTDTIGTALGLALFRLYHSRGKKFLPW